LQVVVDQLARGYDMILVEGFKSVPLACKLWLARTSGEAPPPDAIGVTQVLMGGRQRFDQARRLLDNWLQHLSQNTPVCAGILIGGRSRRMGGPKHLLRVGGLTWLEKITDTVRPFASQIVVLGSGDVPPTMRSLPRLPDVPERRGPLAGMLAAMRWQPGSTWLFVACDLPMISGEALQWLLDQRAPGVWATLPRLAGAPGPEPLLAHYDWRAAPLLEHCSAPADLAHHPAVILPTPPAAIADAWRNFNTAADLKLLKWPTRVRRQASLSRPQYGLRQRRRGSHPTGVSSS
jgi:molybdopterin-guanine dinucleotide biosynthesis protein A